MAGEPKKVTYHLPGMHLKVLALSDPFPHLIGNLFFFRFYRNRVRKALPWPLAQRKRQRRSLRLMVGSALPTSTERLRCDCRRLRPVRRLVRNPVELEHVVERSPLSICRRRSSWRTTERHSKGGGAGAAACRRVDEETRRRCEAAAVWRGRAGTARRGGAAAAAAVPRAGKTIR